MQMASEIMTLEVASAPAHSKLPAVEDGMVLMLIFDLGLLEHGGDAIRGINEQLQANRQRQHVRQLLWAATPHMDMGKGWGRSQARASVW